jgi:hypothetical protein
MAAAAQTGSSLPIAAQTGSSLPIAAQTGSSLPIAAQTEAPLPLELKVTSRGIQNIVMAANAILNLLTLILAIVFFAEHAYGVTVTIAVYWLLIGLALIVVDHAVRPDWVKKYVLFLFTFSGRGLLDILLGITMVVQHNLYNSGALGFSTAVGSIYVSLGILYVIMGWVQTVIPFPDVLPIHLITLSDLQTALPGMQSTAPSDKTTVGGNVYVKLSASEPDQMQQHAFPQEKVPDGFMV